MWMMTFLKMMADLAILLSAAGFFALPLGGHAAPLFLSLPVFALSFSFSFLLKDRGILRFLPPAAAGLLFLYPGLSLTDAVILLTELAYLIWLIIRKAYIPVWGIQTEIFSVYWKVFLGVLLFEWLIAPAETRAMTLPAGLTASACCILLNRSLRHEPSVCRTLRFQAVNLIGLAAVGLIALLLGSETFLGLVGAGLSWFYKTLIAPLIMGVVYLFIQLIKGIAWLFSFIKLKDPEKKDVQDIKLDGLDTEMELIQGGEAVGIEFLTALLIIAAAAAAFFLLKALARSLRKAKQSGTVQTVTGRSVAEETVPESATPRGPVRCIREIYRKFLRLCLRRKVAITRSDTSMDVQKKSERLFEEEDSEALRRLYLKARYRETADEEEAEQARQLYRQLKKEEKKV